MYATRQTEGGVRITDGVSVPGNKGAPASGSVTVKEEQFGALHVTTFTLAKYRLTVTDAAASGSYGTSVLYTFPTAAIAFLGSRQDYTSFVEGAALTGAVGDAAFEIGLGTTAIAAAADGTLGNAVNENVGQAVAVTNSGGTGAGTAVNGALTTAFNGTASAITLNLNWSGSAATIDANSTIDVTGTATVAWLDLGDD